ncbi:MAG: hypothetical protein H7843_03795 [Nitrospirota bacterium]
MSIRCPLGKEKSVNIVSFLIVFSSTYRHSTARMVLSAERTFSLELECGQIICISQGIKGKHSNQVHAIEDKGIYKIEFTVLGFIKERRIDDSMPDSTENNYGMRYFPFVSSMICSNIKIVGGIFTNIMIELPDAYRLIWEQSMILNTDFIESKLDHSYASTASTYIFTWEQQSLKDGQYQFNIYIRHGSNEIMKLIEFPLMYYVISLAAIWLAYSTGTQDYGKRNLVLAAIGAIFSFMLKRWSNANLPQKNTLLTRAYLTAGLLSVFWGAGWLIGGIWALAMIPSFAIYFIMVYHASKKYELDGILPRYIANYWSDKVKSAVDIQKKSYHIK